MSFLGIGLGMMVACLWGLADIFATLAARHSNAFKTTLVSQLTSFLGLLLIGAGAFWSARLSFTLSDLLHSLALGVFTGFCAALAYLALYRALELGPVTITGPLTATSPIFTLLLSAFFLQERLAPLQIGLVLFGILGIVLASTNLPELYLLLTKFRFYLWTPGVRWAIVATLAFGSLDFGIGASVSVSDWFLPGLSTRFFTLLFLLLFTYGLSLWRKYYVKKIGASAARNAFARISLSGFEVLSSLWQPSLTSSRRGIRFALLVGVIESVAILIFSFDTRLVTTGVTSALAASYGLVVLLFGMLAYRERLVLNQFLGIALFMLSIILLALI